MKRRWIVALRSVEVKVEAESEPEALQRGIEKLDKIIDDDLEWISDVEVYPLEGMDDVIHTGPLLPRESSEE